MTSKGFLQLVSQSIRRNRRDLALSSVGIAVGVAILVVFTSLGAGIKSVVLEEIFVIDRLEVVPPSYSVSEGLFGGGRTLDDDVVDRLRNHPGVRRAYPKMKLAFPASARGGEELVGRDVVVELVADGLPADLVGDDLAGDYAFRDYGRTIDCSKDNDCPTAHVCRKGTCRGASCRGPADCEDPAFCATTDNQCRMPIPVVVSPKLLEIYNSSLRKALGGAAGPLSNLGRLSPETLVGFEVEAVFGQSYIGRSAKGGTLRHRLKLAGFSDRAIDMGATIPIGYVRRLNRRFRGKQAARSYDSIVVETRNNAAVTEVAQFVRDDLGLQLSDDYNRAKRAGFLITVLTLVFDLISGLILLVAAINIAHTFLTIVLQRRREIGLMRAIGATRGDLRWLILGESTAVGLAGGLAGLAAGLGAVELIDYAFASYVADFPFKPASLFAVAPWMVAGAVGVALLFAWLGALAPAIRASRIDPAEALTSR